MQKLSEQIINETTGINVCNPRITAYLESDHDIFSPLFHVLGEVENQGEANYIMTSLIKAYKELFDTNTVFIANNVVSLSRAFNTSTKNDEIIVKGIKACEKLSLIEYDAISGEINLTYKCFDPAYVI